MTCTINTRNWIDCTGDAAAGDTVRFTESVFGGPCRKPKFLGEREVVALVLRDSYGADKQQHTFSLRIISSSGYDPLAPGRETRRKGRNLYRNGTQRLAWDNEAARRAALDDKHERGDSARAARRGRKENGHGW